MKKLIIALSSLALTACVSQPYMAKQQYLLHTAQKTFQSPHTLPVNLSVEPTVAVAPYDNQAFVYRLKRSHYTSDFYHIFMVPPATQITQNTLQYLQKTHLFNHVNAANLLLPAQYHLKSQLVALYANYRNDQKPTAVVKVQYILLKSGHIVFTQLYRSKVALSSKSTVALVHAWNQGLNGILRHFSKDLFHHFYPGVKLHSHHTKAMTTATKKTTSHTVETTSFLRLTPAKPQIPKATVKKKPAKVVKKTVKTVKEKKPTSAFLRLDANN